MSVLPPERSTYEYDDYASVAFTDTETSYTVGTNANSAVSGSWPTGLKAQSILLYATQDCYVRFDNALGVQHRLFAGNFYMFHRRCSTIYVVRVTADGTLHIWLEG